MLLQNNFSISILTFAYYAVEVCKKCSSSSYTSSGISLEYPCKNSIKKSKEPPPPPQIKNGTNTQSI